MNGMSRLPLQKSMLTTSSSDECNNLPEIVGSSTRRSPPRQRPTLRHNSSSWRRKAVVAWKDGTGALRRINHRRNSYIPSGFEIVTSRISWIYIRGRR